MAFRMDRGYRAVADMTPKQLAFVKLYRENKRNETGKSVRQMMLEVGYHEKTAGNPKRALKSIQPHIARIDRSLEQSLTDVIATATEYITPEKLEQTNPKDLAYIISTLQKSLLLVQGKATKNVAHVHLDEDGQPIDLSKLTDEQLNKLLEQ